MSSCTLMYDAALIALKPFGQKAKNPCKTFLRMVEISRMSQQSTWTKQGTFHTLSWTAVRERQRGLSSKDAEKLFFIQFSVHSILMSLSQKERMFYTDSNVTQQIDRELDLGVQYYCSSAGFIFSKSLIFITYFLLPGLLLASYSTYKHSG